MAKVIRFKDGQMISPDRITGLMKFDRYPDNTPVVQVTGMDGHVTIECGSSAEQEQVLHSLSKKLENYIDVEDLIELDESIGKKVN